MAVFNIIQRDFFPGLPTWVKINLKYHVYICHGLDLKIQFIRFIDSVLKDWSQYSCVYSWGHREMATLPMGSSVGKVIAIQKSSQV